MTEREAIKAEVEAFLTEMKKRRGIFDFVPLYITEHGPNGMERRGQEGWIVRPATTET
jgi:hypothetical protein